MPRSNPKKKAAPAAAWARSMALGDELAVLTACGDELAVLIGARTLCVQCARTRTLLRKSMPRHVVACMAHGHGMRRQQSAPRGRIIGFSVNDGGSR